MWGVYVQGSVRYWASVGRHNNPLFNIMFWNPILYIVAAVLLTYGAVRGWLCGEEVVLGVGLLGIPYLARSYEMSMASHARFAAVVVCDFLVIGRLLGAAPRPVVYAVVATCAVLLCTWSALFAGGGLMF
jgi:hypothetical protein